MPEAGRFSFLISQPAGIDAVHAGKVLLARLLALARRTLDPLCSGRRSGERPYAGTESSMRPRWRARLNRTYGSLAGMSWEEGIISIRLAG
jgi:hypothetical protein